VTTATVTSCAGSVEHETEILLRPAVGRPGMVRIDKAVYLVTCLGSMDEFEITKEGGTPYRVSHWSDRPGNFSCTCRDFQFRSRRSERFCKHLNVIHALKSPPVLTVNDLLTIAWEE
jgi:hypothetical protein